MTAIHQALVHNTFDTTGTWGPKALEPPELSRQRAINLLKHRKGQTPPAPIVMIPKIAVSPSVTTVRHELVVFSKQATGKPKSGARE